MKKRMVSMLCAGALVLGTIVCPNVYAEAGEVVEIRASWWGDTTRNEKYDEIIRRFEAANPDVKVIREFGTWADYWDKMATQMAGGNAPDMMGSHAAFLSDYTSRGLYADLTPFVESGIIDTTYMEDSVLEATAYHDGIMFGIPMGLTMASMICNQTLFDKYGIENLSMTDDYTWQDLMEWGEIIKEKADAAGETAYIIDDYSAYWGDVFTYWVRGCGKEFFDDNGQLGFSKEILTDWFTYWKEMRDKGIIPDAATAVENAVAPLEQRMVSQGIIGMYMTPANNLYQIEEQVPEAEFSIARMPVQADGGRGESLAYASWSVNANSDPEKQEAAARLINFWINTEESNEIYMTDQGVSCNTEMAKYTRSIADESTAKVIDFVSENSSLARRCPLSPSGVTEIVTAFEDAASGVQFEQLTPEEAAEQFFAQAEIILAQ